jgi:hypothetical protein
MKYLVKFHILTSMKTDVANASETSGNIYRTTQHNNPDDRDLY